MKKFQIISISLIAVFVMGSSYKILFSILPDITTFIQALTLAFLVISTILLIFIEGGLIDFQVKDNWIDLLQLVLITVIGAYFGDGS